MAYFSRFLVPIGKQVFLPRTLLMRRKVKIHKPAQRRYTKNGTNRRGIRINCNKGKSKENRNNCISPLIPFHPRPPCPPVHPRILNISHRWVSPIRQATFQQARINAFAMDIPANAEGFKFGFPGQYKPVGVALCHREV